MTKEVLIQIRELDAVAEKAGGYVAAPGSLCENPKGEREFSAIRKYSLASGKPISKLNRDDYRKIGIDQIPR